MTICQNPRSRRPGAAGHAQQRQQTHAEGNAFKYALPFRHLFHIRVVDLSTLFHFRCQSAVWQTWWPTHRSPPRPPLMACEALPCWASDSTVSHAPPPANPRHTPVSRPCASPGLWTADQLFCWSIPLVRLCTLPDMSVMCERTEQYPF